MLIKAVDALFSEFVTKQEAVMGSVGERLEQVLSKIQEMSSKTGINYGCSPFIVDDGDDALLLAHSDGTYVRLSRSFVVDAESVNEDYDAIYSSLFPVVGMLRFIPANPDFEFPVYSPRTPCADNELFSSAVNTSFEFLINTTIELTKIQMAKNIIALESVFTEEAKNSGLSSEEFYKSPEVLRSFATLFKQAINDSSELAESIANGDADLVTEE